MKRLMDILGAGAALVFLSPVMLLTAIVIMIFNPGPLIFKQKRLGHLGKEFYIYKFRTMVVNAEQILESDKMLRILYEKNNFSLNVNTDPRVTKIGRFLRKTSLDECPQFFNVLKGEMSLVGPRPIVAKEIMHYGGQKEAFLSMKPGITGYWQISGRSEINYPERVDMEMYYVRNHNLLLDVKIISRTIVSVLLRRGAY